MKTKTISLFLGLSALVCLADARAITIAENTAGVGAFKPFQFFGQSFTTVLGPTSNIALNFFASDATPVAVGDGFLLSMEYLGTPAGLSSSTPGFLGQTTASGGLYTFDPSLTLLPNTQYFFYENASISGLFGLNSYAGGQVYQTGFSNSAYVPLGISLNFRVTGTPVGTGVPDNGSTAVLLGTAVLVLGVASRYVVTR